MAGDHSPRLACHCAICGESFGSKGELSDHAANHKDASSNHTCNDCGRTLNSTHALEIHCIQENHARPAFTCDKCNRTFCSQRDFLDHSKSLSECEAAVEGEEVEMPIYCDRCQETFTTQKGFNRHRSNLNNQCADFRHAAPKKSPSPTTNKYVDLDIPKDDHPTITDYGEEGVTQPSILQTKTNENVIQCPQCKKTFHSYGHYNSHWLGCTLVASSPKTQTVATELHAKVKASKPARKNTHPLVVNYTNPQGPNLVVASPMQTVTLNTRPPVRQAQQVSEATSSRAPPAHYPPVADEQAANGAVFVCDINGCGRVCRSEPGLRQHGVDAHGIGGQRLDLTGRESWMLNARERDRLRQEGLLRQPSGSSRGRGGGHSPRRPLATARPPPSAARPSHAAARPPPATIRPSPATTHPSPATTRPPAAASQSPINGRSSGPLHHPQHQQPVPSHVPLAIIPAGADTSGAAELEEAKNVQAKILRLLIQANIFIGHEGNVTVCDLKWTRVQVYRQPEVLAAFDRMCHLPKILQSEYLPVPKAFKDDYTIQYPSTEFESAPAHDTKKPALRVVALSCSRIVLADGLQEVVKIAAVDVLTCRILMNHLVCTDPDAEVRNWCSTVTGLFGWADFEAARRFGYRVFKGWPAARAALWKFIDKDTIVVGHNLRSDLDALRMIHGRAVDIAKVVEKAANGPLNKAQLSLDSLCRDYPAITLKSDPEYGRDVLLNAFSIREFGLWVVKNDQKFQKNAKQKSLDYQRVMPSAVAVT
ncbi:RNA exonuclease [Pyrenophora tritici-repentis]|uniref:RNA exonuclease n=1 Tax=Pyrenophora tritici-repentis TaxID=45151 RepID=A0A2W1ERP9_9PLEO|nr:RNA exonuclease [Pyrenophora tritici-repentis]KAF7570826.1 RNA exonuclease [Pyrenophora tritici-repentis]KAI0589106.1 RNA exonuclease [Pyrenophora tritici-repentis]KAI0591264.1 RNA exonuclease [Pyrenophora tritici-repentis]KAI0615603.1 RNA exonuclease [Pyrenophora tritici-repentis]